METFLNILRPLPPVCPDLVRPQVSVRFFNLPPLKEAAREEDLQKDSGVRESKTKKTDGTWDARGRREFPFLGGDLISISWFATIQSSHLLFPQTRRIIYFRCNRLDSFKLSWWKSRRRRTGGQKADGEGGNVFQCVYNIPFLPSYLPLYHFSFKRKAPRTHPQS